MKIKDASAVESYSVAGVRQFSFEEAVRLYKTCFGTFENFLKRIDKHPGLGDFCRSVELAWDNATHYTVTEGLQEINVERRRAIFHCIGVDKMFQELQPEILDQQVITKVNHRWDKDNIAYEEVILDKYELFCINSKMIQIPELINEIFIVKCSCPSTQREYFIYVPAASVKSGSYDESGKYEIRYDAISAIAWTIRIAITNPLRIYRQGDVIITEASPDSKICEPYHLSKQQYLKLMYAET